MKKRQRKIILCIDDNLEVLKSLRLQLRQNFKGDVRIILAEGSEEALNTLDALDLSQNDMLLIVSDWLMPNINGEELIQMIEQRWGLIMTIVLSGHITPEAKARLVSKEQVVSVLSKPWNGDDLTDLITTSLMSSNQSSKSSTQSTEKNLNLVKT